MFPAVVKLRVSRAVADALSKLEHERTDAGDELNAVQDEVLAAGLAALGEKVRAAPKSKAKGKKEKS